MVYLLWYLWSAYGHCYWIASGAPVPIEAANGSARAPRACQQKAKWRRVRYYNQTNNFFTTRLEFLIENKKSTTKVLLREMLVIDVRIDWKGNVGGEGIRRRNEISAVRSIEDGRNWSGNVTTRVVTHHLSLIFSVTAQMAFKCSRIPGKIHKSRWRLKHDEVA